MVDYFLIILFIHFRPAFLSECQDLIRGSTLLGLQKSFSTTDITNKTLEKINSRNVRHAVSELTLNSIMLDNSRLSRSCSTWAQPGELASTSQLPSPHGHCNNLTITSSQQLSITHLFGHNQITSTSQSMNKNIRESYIRNRLLTTHRAIERLSQSEFNLDQLASTIAVTECPGSPGPVELIIPEKYMNKPANQFDDPGIQLRTTASPCTQQRTKYKLINAANISRNLTIQDIEKERGRPLSKYDRNFMIFNWLHSLDESSVNEDSSQ